MNGDAPAGAGVYAGLRIVELAAGGAAAPLATRYFAEQGADVVRIECARGPDPARDERAAAARGALVNAGKRSVAIDLARAQGAALALRLAARADVVVEDFPPGALEALGLGPAQLLAARPDLVVLSSTPFGRTGPLRAQPSAAGQGAALAGFTHLTGCPDRAPLAAHDAAADALAARYAAAAIAAALLARAATGRGQHLDLAQLEVGVHALSEGVVRWTGAGEAIARAGNRDERAAPHGVYPCDGDDAWIAIAVRDELEWDALCAAMGDPAWAADERFATSESRRAHADLLDERLAAWTRAFAPYDLMAGLQQAGVPAGVVQTPAALLRDPQLAHRGHFARVAHPEGGALLVERSGFRLAAHPGGFACAGPRRGEHTDEVLGELGLAAGEIAALRARGVLG